MTRRALLLSTLVLLLRAAAAPAQPPPDAPGFRDRFTGDTKAKYESKGDVAWREGAVTLRGAAPVPRRAPLGYSAVLRATVRWPPDTRDGTLQFALLGDQTHAAAGVGLHQGEPLLLVAAASPKN